jgi:hypothetical protein
VELVVVLVPGSDLLSAGVEGVGVQLLLHVGAEKQLEIQVTMMILQEQIHGTTLCLISSRIKPHLKFNLVDRLNNDVIKQK